MKVKKEKSLQEYRAAYSNVMALYGVIKYNSDNAKVKRAVLRQGEVAPEPIDFAIDVELKAKRELVGNENLLWDNVTDDPDASDNLPVHLQFRLGKIFLENRLDVDGHYKRLFFIMKNKKYNKGLE